MINPASSKTFKCCITVQRSMGAKASHRAPVACGLSFKQSQHATADRMRQYLFGGLYPRVWLLNTEWSCNSISTWLYR